MFGMEQSATTVQKTPEVEASDTGWSELGAVLMAVAVLAFLVPYIWLAIRRFEKVTDRNHTPR